jgi:serine/threonine protein kinase
MDARAPVIVGRYAIYDRIAAGGMATVHLGRLVGEAGFSRTVAIKRLHAHFAMDPDFVAMFLDEARLAARIRHPNVVQTLDVVVQDGEVFLVMDYVEGESLAHLMRILVGRGEPMPPACASALILPVLHGLHAAHEAKNDHGEPLGLVHRDVTPQNILVGVDGVPRVLDFGVAKALGQSHTTREGQLKGKLAYMAPEQIEIGRVDRRTDVFAASVVLWEALTGRRLFKADGEAQVMNLVLKQVIAPPSAFAAGVSPELDAVVLRGLERDPSARFATAEQMADAIEEAAPPTPQRKVAAWVRLLLGDKLSARAKLVQEIESASTGRKADLDSLPLSEKDAADGSIDVTIARPLEEPPPQGSSQASSISVEAPRRASVPPRPPRRSLLMLGVGALLCGGVLGLAIALRAPHPASSSAPSEPEGSSVASAAPPAGSLPSPASVPVTALPSAALPEPVEADASASGKNAQPPAASNGRRPPATPPRSTTPAPPPSSKLYSRF